MERRKNVNEILEQIFISLIEAGYDPVEQLYAYLETEDVRYITRKNQARDLIRTIKKEDIENFVKSKK